MYPLLPEEFQAFLLSPEFVTQCMTQFDALDTDKNGVLTPDELAPVVSAVANSQPWDVTYAQCQEFAAVFDADGNGTIEKNEFAAKLKYPRYNSRVHTSLRPSH